jgi:hypothetical protein
MSSPQVTPNPVSPQEFAAKVKDKYPAYSKMDDGELIQKVLQKYPEYGSQIKTAGWAQRKSDHANVTITPSTPSQPTRTDKFAHFIERNDPTIGAAMGSVAGGMVGGLPGAVAGAGIGGAGGSALQQKFEKGKVDPKEAAKAGGIQSLWELGGGLVGKGIAKTAGLLGIPDAVMKFALHTGEDLESGLNPAAAMNKFKVRSLLNADLFRKTGTQIDSLSKVADGIMDQAIPYSSSVRPYAVIKGVLSKYQDQAVKTADPEIRDAMQKMLQNVEHEFGESSGQGAVASVTAKPGSQAVKGAAKGLPTDRVLSIKDANAIKRAWGDTVDWSKAPVTDKMQAVFTAEMAARRDIYNALNKSIADSMGGNEGKIWLAKNKDIQNLMEAKSLIKKSAEGLQSHGKNILESLTDKARKPGVGSRVAQAGQAATTGAQVVGNNLPNIGRGAALVGDATMGTNK